jgi:hypothetical protein
MRRREFIAGLGSAAASSAIWPLTARAQVFPSRPITVVIGFAAGGPTDTAVRILAEGMRASLSQNVIRLYIRRRRHQDNVDLHADQFGCHFRQLLDPFRPAELKDNVLALDVA